jgi:predicted RNA-binding Zn-ribbon protein involved in translation (DUF1610 family)
MLDRSKLWISAGIALARDPSAAVLCPNCGQANLEVQDIEINSEKRERRIYCQNCGHQNYLLFSNQKVNEI